jgi:hypothetical protein
MEASPRMNRTKAANPVRISATTEMLLTLIGRPLESSVLENTREDVSRFHGTGEITPLYHPETSQSSGGHKIGHAKKAKNPIL